jgi:hypothetical protein
MSGQKTLPIDTVYTHPKVRYDSVITYFFNPTYGIDMNQNGGFSGTPEKIHNGTDTAEWTASDLVGNRFVFDSTTRANTGTKSIDGSGTRNDDLCLFTAPAPVASGSYVAVTGFIYYSSITPPQSQRDVNIQFRLAGVDNGNEVQLFDYTDPTRLGLWQKFVIPIEDFGLTGNIDELTLKTISLVGTPSDAPDYLIDDLQLEESGNSITFETTPPSGDVWEVETVNVTYAGAGTDDSIPYDKFHNLSELINGVILTRETEGNIVKFILSVKNNSDFFTFPDIDRVDSSSDGVNSWMSFQVRFPRGSLFLDSSVGEKLTVTINDDLTSLGLFRISACMQSFTLNNNPPIRP